jgi:hypothetical protein
MEKNLKLIRGQRIIQQLQFLDEATYAELERNTVQFQPQSKKRQFAINPVQVQTMQLIPHAESGTLEARAQVNSGGNKYQSIVVFTGVVFQEEDTPQNITFKGADEQDYHILSISLQQTNVKVRCTCLDFRWRFSVQNQEADALWGNGPGMYQKKTDRDPNNRRNVPGLCKHLMKVAIELKNSNLVKT